jgi:TolA-binding protein
VEPVAAQQPVVEPVASAHRPPHAKPVEAATADLLFARALEARRGTDPLEAESTLQAFLARYPKDRRAGVAAFELGRLRMDVSHDNAGALSALSRALTLSPRAAFAEDALARIVQVHHASGDRRACAEGKAAYMKRYPAGAYAASLAPLCP